MKRKLRANHLGEAVRAARLLAGLTQVQLMQAMSYEYNVVSSWENSSKPLTADEWTRLCGLLPALDEQLGQTHAGELALEEGRKLKPRPSRLDQQVTAALNGLLTLKAGGRALTDVAADMQLDYVALWKMLKGTTNPTLPQVRVIAAYFEVDTDQVLGVRPVEAPTYAALLRLVARQREDLQDLARVRVLNDMLLEQRALCEE